MYMAESQREGVDELTGQRRPDPEVPSEWVKEQEELKDKIITTDCEPWQIERLIEQTECEENSENNSSSSEEGLEKSIQTLKLTAAINGVSSRPLQYVAGVDLSYLKNNETTACAALVVCRMPSLEVVYEDITSYEVSIPYIAGFLSFRETPALVQAFQRLRENSPEYIPQVILVDGNGLLHYREAGIACHFGVTVNVPTVGVAKNLLAVDVLAKNEEHKDKIANLKNTGDSFPLSTRDGKVLGKAVKTCEGAQNPVYVSVGHRISLDTAVWLVLQCSKYRVPEPIREADQRSRSFLRKKFPSMFPAEKKKSPSKKSKAVASAMSKCDG